MGKKTLTAGAGIARSAKRARAREVPSTSAMASMSRGGSKRLEIADDKLHVGLYEYMQNGSLYSNTFTDGRVWVAQMATSRLPSPLFHFTLLIQRHGEAHSKANDPPPKNVGEVANRYRAHLQFVSKSTADLDGIGWAKNRMGFYIDETMVKEFFMYFDDLMTFRRGLADADFDWIDGPTTIMIHMLDSAPIQLKFDKDHDQLGCEFVVVEDAVAFMSVFDLPPPTFPYRIVTVSFEMLTSAKVNVIFGGNTKPFQAGFAQRSVGLCTLKKDLKDPSSNPYAEYFRVIENVDISASQTCIDYLKDFLDTCLQGAPVLVRIRKTTCDTTAIEAIIQSLQTAMRHMRVEG
jgi:hypothetical protein